MSTKQLFHPRYDVVIADEAITEGTAVNLKTDARTVEAVDNTADRVHGFARFAAAAKGDTIEIYREGGEAIGLAGADITFGADLVVNGSGELIPTTTASDNCIGYALEAVDDADLVRFMFTRFTR